MIADNLLPLPGGLQWAQNDMSCFTTLKDPEAADLSHKRNIAANLVASHSFMSSRLSSTKRGIPEVT